MDSLSQVLGYALLAAFAVLLLLAVRKVFFRQRPELREAPPPSPGAKPGLPLPPPAPRVELPPSAAEAEKRAAVEAAHREAEALAAQRRAVADAAKQAADEPERALLEQQARALKDAEEDKKKEEYRARKEAEAAAKERRTREREEEARLQSEAEARAREEAEAAAAAAAEAERKKVAAEAGQVLARGLDRTRTQGFVGRLNQLFGGARQVDESVLAELEEVLFTADIGVRTASRLVDVAREKARRNELGSTDRIKGLIREEVASILSLPAPRSLGGGGPPHVVMVVGVNGAGKTTTIGKLAAKLRADGKKVVLGAGDTFRAAAAEQLDVWAERAGAELVKGADGADPGSVVFEAVKRAQAVGADVIIADTAGRLHTQAPLMDELKKVRRVIDKAQPGAPHEVLLVLDATIGQNAIAQAKQFHEAVGVTALALTKLDGTAKGGVVIGISDELKLPVAWVGVGEGVEDLRPFVPGDFVKALFD
jgi:fused signal recognition particle receptor